MATATIEIDGDAIIVAEMERIHAEIFQKHFIPLIQNISGLTPEGQVVAKGHIVNGVVVIDMHFEYANKYVDAWETAQRIIFNEFFKQGLEHYSAMKK